MAITNVTAEILAAITGVQKTRNKGISLESNPVFAYLLKHGTIKSDNPLLVQVNPKYATDAVWAGLAVSQRKELAEAGYYITAVGKNPRTYTLRKVSDLMGTIKPATVPTTTVPATKTGN